MQLADVRGALVRLIASIGLVCAALPVWGGVDVKDVRVWAGPDATRVVFDLSGPANHSVMTLQNPERVVVDISSAKAPTLARALPEAQGFVKQIRLGEQSNGDLRIVIDLAASATPKSFPVGPSGNYGHRLVVDLEP